MDESEGGLAVIDSAAELRHLASVVTARGATGGMANRLLKRWARDKLSRDAWQALHGALDLEFRTTARFVTALNAAANFHHYACGDSRHEDALATAVRNCKLADDGVENLSAYVVAETLRRYAASMPEDVVPSAEQATAAPDGPNAREQLEQAARWLGFQSEDMSYGLLSAEDGLKLYRFGMAHPELAEMADEWDGADRVAALGYDPFDRALSAGAPSPR